jgi:hypothetical protein
MSFPMQPCNTGGDGQYHLYAPNAANDGNCTWCGSNEASHYIP